MTQARTTPRPEPDDDWAPVPTERRLPPLPTDEVLELEEEDLPTVPASDIPQIDEEPGAESTAAGGDERGE
jgi:hypothetical protein